MGSLRAQEYLREYERDRNSIFVGSIPEGYTENQLRALFEHYGAIVRITIHQRPSERNRKANSRVASYA
jgi:RNA recognition motif-containing protein